MMNRIYNNKITTIVLILVSLASILIITKYKKERTDIETFIDVTEESLKVNKKAEKDIQRITSKEYAEKRVKDREQTLAKKEEEARIKAEKEQEEKLRQEEEERIKAEKEEEERIKREEEERIKAEKEQEEENRKAEEKAQMYNTGITWEDLARDKDGKKGSLVRFSGKIEQVMNSEEDDDDLVQCRLSVDGDLNKIIYIGLRKNILEHNVLEEDWVTVEGASIGNVTYKTVLGKSTTVPGIAVANIYYN